MSSNSFGLLPRITVFGQSHDPEIGVVIEGFPAGVAIDEEWVASLLARRRPGLDARTTARRETDEPIVASGIVDGMTDGSPIRVTFKNTDTRRSDYELFRTIPRPSHADFLATRKYGYDHDIAGGGRFSGRLTLPVTYAGALCLQVLSTQGIEVEARLVEVDGSSHAIDEHIMQARDEGDSIGGIVELVATGLPAGIGEHPYQGVEPFLAPLLFAIPGVRGVEFGAGFDSAQMRGSEHNDAWVIDADGQVKTATNNAGGVIGGMTTGMPLILRVAFKPTASIALKQTTVNLKTGQPEVLEIKGRHDPCIAVRAVPVVEAAVAIGLLNLIQLDSSTVCDNLDEARRAIDALDDELVTLVGRRMALAERIGAIKQERGLPVVDEEREKRILTRLTALKPPALARALSEMYQVLFSHSRKHQSR